MPKINVLDQSTINKIAAGEVIERPASVVKELLENAIDAKATAVTVEIREGGVSFIRITDNGSGMAKEDARLAFLSHATSKIQSADDLFTVTSLGFRGEALSSIAAVARVELITKTAGSLTGFRYMIEGGEETALEEIGAPEGTTFIVRDLFFNTPVRKKFLKTPSGEGSHVADLVEKIALSHPEVSVRFIQNNQNKLHTSGNHNIKDMVYAMFGREIAGNLLAVDGTAGLIQVRGLIGKPVIARANRNYELYFINGRYVRSPIIAKAIEEAYRPYMMQRKYPFTLLYLTLEPELFDINVHPSKMELRFKDGEQVYTAVFAALKAALANKELIPQVSVGSRKDDPAGQAGAGPQERASKRLVPAEKKPSIPEPFEKNRMAAMAALPSRPAVAGETCADPDGNRPWPLGAGSGLEGLAADRVAETAAPYHVGGAGRQGLGGEAQWERAQGLEGEMQLQRLQGQEGKAQPQEQEGKAQPQWQEGKAQPQWPQGKAQWPQGLAGKEQPQVLPGPQAQAVADAARQMPTAMSGHLKLTDVGAVGEQMDLFAAKLLEPRARKQHKLIGQLFDTYWLVEYKGQLFIIDQHAAHEKVLYEQLMASLKEKEFTSQMLEPPIILTLSAQEELLLQAYLPHFTGIGFEIEPFGGREYAVRGVPGNLFAIAKKELLIEMLDGLSADGTVPNVGASGKKQVQGTEVLYDKVATMSCRAAVKGNRRLSASEADALIDQLLGLDNPYACPHGRPTIISMTKYELEKKFKRVVV